MIIIVILLGTFLRMFDIGSNYFFTGELGKELLYMRSFSLVHSLPLTGMATSHEWLYYGPVYYWIMIPFYNLFRGNPYILFWAALVVALIGLILNYFVFKKIAGEKIALISTAIQSFSPLLIWQTRLSKLHVFFYILTPLFTYLTYLLWNGKKKWVFWAGLTYGLMFSFHFSQIPILGVVILFFYLKRKIYRFFDWLKFAAGLLLANITLVIYDAGHGFTMTKDLILWIPYRILGFAGLYPKNNLDAASSAGTLQSFIEYMGKNIFWDSRAWIIGSIIVFLVLIHFVITRRSRITKDFLTFYLVSSIGFVFLANLIHTAPPIHYFLPIFTLIPVLLAIYLGKTRFWLLILIAVVLINLFSFRVDPQFYGSADELISDIDLVPYSLQDSLTSFIVKDAKGKPFTIKRIGPYDYFPEEYSQNYKYLVLWKGGNLVDKSGLIYTIVEDVQRGEVYVQK